MDAKLVMWIITTDDDKMGIFIFFNQWCSDCWRFQCATCFAVRKILLHRRCDCYNPQMWISRIQIHGDEDAMRYNRIQIGRQLHALSDETGCRLAQPNSSDIMLGFPGTGVMPSHTPGCHAYTGTLVPCCSLGQDYTRYTAGRTKHWR